MNEKCRPDDYPPYEPQGALAKRIAARMPKPAEPKWQPAWLKNLTARDESGRLVTQ